MQFWTRRALPHIFLVFFVLISIVLFTVLEAAAESDTLEYRKKLSLFGGVTHEGSDNGASIGLEYSYRLNTYLGIGGFAEYAGGDFDSWVIGLPVFIFPYAGWYFGLGPGLEFVDSETNFLFRVGTGYEFEFMPRWALAPEIMVDFVDGDTKLIYGIALVWAF